MKKIAFSSLFFLMLLLLSCSPAFKIKEPIDLSEKSPFSLQIKWERKIGAGQQGTSPIIHDGYLIFGTSQSWIYMYNAQTGKKHDRMWADMPMTISPTVTDNVMLFSGIGEWNRLFATDLSTGQRLWNSTARSVGPPIIGNDSTHIFVTRPGGVYRIHNRSGKILANVKLRDSIRNSGCLSDSVLIFAGRSIHMLKYPELSKIAEMKLDFAVSGGIICTDLGYLTILEDGRIILFDENGVLDESPSIGKSSNSLAIWEETVFAVSDSGVIHAFSTENLQHEIWNRKITGTDDYSSFVSPMVIRDGVLTISYRGHAVYSNSHDGHVISELELSDKFNTDGLVFGDRVYLTSIGGKVICLE